MPLFFHVSPYSHLPLCLTAATYSDERRERGERHPEESALSWDLKDRLVMVVMGRGEGVGEDVKIQGVRRPESWGLDSSC